MIYLLPEELIFYISNFLNIGAVIHFGRTCKLTFRICREKMSEEEEYEYFFSTINVKFLIKKNKTEIFKKALLKLFSGNKILHKNFYSHVRCDQLYFRELFNYCEQCNNVDFAEMLYRCFKFYRPLNWNSIPLDRILANSIFDEKITIKICHYLHGRDYYVVKGFYDEYYANFLTKSIINGYSELLNTVLEIRFQHNQRCHLRNQREFYDILRVNCNLEILQKIHFSYGYIPYSYGIYRSIKNEEIKNFLLSHCGKSFRNKIKRNK